MILLTGLYHDPDAGRRAELRECLRRNAENVLINEIHLFSEDAVAAESLQSDPVMSLNKIRLVPHGRRLTFRDLFDYSNRALGGQGVIAANADIFFDDSLALLDGYDLRGRLLCLSRWDVQADGSASFFEHPASQDAWIFRAPVSAFSCSFPLGVPGCENRLAWEAQRSGLKLANPGRSIKANHLHLSQVRNYTERQRLRGATESVTATFMETRYPSARGPAPAAACARVAFHETMGYTVARLALGVSSHNNEPRPFTAIPQALAGLLFTQVVACVVSPVEVEFLTAGKLYVLVGNDWAGHHPNTEWLSHTGFREALPLVETQARTGFEVWSLVAEAGERFVLPTQVMLAAAELVKNDGQRRFPVAEHHTAKDFVPEGSLNPSGGERVVRAPTRHLLIAARQKCGLWSMFFQVIGLIRYAERHGLEPVVYFNDATCWWSPDGYNGSRNAWEYFFEPLGHVSATELFRTKNIETRNIETKSSSLEHASLQQIQAALPGDVVMSDYILDHVGHYDHTEAQRQEYAAIVERRIRVKSQVLQKLNPTLVAALASGATAVHYRGTDKSCESPRQPIHDYYDALQHRVDPSHKLFVATDDAPFLNWMIETYGDRVLYTPAARSANQIALHLGPHRGPQQAEECLLDVLLMAKCRHLVHGNSSVTNGVLAFNPTMSHEALHRPESERSA
jgi:hypothetical protein